MSRRFLARAAIFGLAACTVGVGAAAALRPAAVQRGNGAITFSDMCWHDRWSQYHCPDTTYGTSIPVAEIQSVAISVQTKNGMTVARTLPANVDAIFLTREAVQNMLVRYYDATDRAKAASLRTRIQRRPQ